MPIRLVVSANILGKRFRIVFASNKDFFCKIHSKAEIRALDVCPSLCDGCCSKEIENSFNDFSSNKKNLQNYVHSLESTCHRNSIF